MGLIEKGTCLTAGPSHAYKTSVHTSALSLLHTLVRKVTKVLKNQKTLTSNQKQLVACYNADHSEHPIHLGSVSGSDSKPEAEVGFEVQSPQLGVDSQSEDEVSIPLATEVIREEVAQLDGA